MNLAANGTASLVFIDHVSRAARSIEKCFSGNLLTFSQMPPTSKERSGMFMQRPSQSPDPNPIEHAFRFKTKPAVKSPDRDKRLGSIVGVLRAQKPNLCPNT